MFGRCGKHHSNDELVAFLPPLPPRPPLPSGMPPLDTQSAPEGVAVAAEAAAIAPEVVAVAAEAAAIAPEGVAVAAEAAAIAPEVAVEAEAAARAAAVASVAKIARPVVEVEGIHSDVATALAQYEAVEPGGPTNPNYSNSESSYEGSDEDEGDHGKNYAGDDTDLQQGR